MALDLQPLFRETILEQTALIPSYTDHTNHIWRVRTAAEEVVVRVPRPEGELTSAFWWGCREFFGLDPSRPDRLAPLNDRLYRLSPIPVPRILRTGTIDGRPYAIAEYLPGERLTDLRALPAAALRELGVALARIHRHQFTWWGAPTGALHHTLDTFHPRLVATLRALVHRFFAGHPTIAPALPCLCAAALLLPPPTVTALIMVDVDATQFLTNGARLTALVDTDAYAIAPAALDFIGYEYELDAFGAAALASGYRTLLPLPNLTAVRPVYRYLYRLLGTQGQVDFAEWMAWPTWFDGC